MVTSVGLGGPGHGNIMPPRADLHLVVEQGRSTAFVCDICGVQMPFREIEAHKHASHADALRNISRAQKHFAWEFMLLLGPATILFFVAVFTPGYVIAVHAPGWYLVVVLWLWLASMPLSWHYARQRTRAEFDVLGNLPHRCRVCLEWMPNRELRGHLAGMHPRDFRYARISAYVVFGSLFGILTVLYVFASAYFLDLVPFVSTDVLQIWVYGALLGWMGLIILWGLLVDPRLTAKARSEWQTSHPASQIPRP